MADVDQGIRSSSTPAANFHTMQHAPPVVKVGSCMNAFLQLFERNSLSKRFSLTPFNHRLSRGMYISFAANAHHFVMH
jgi:hypothetical protein